MQTFLILPPHPHAGSLCYPVGETERSITAMDNMVLVEIKNSDARCYVERNLLQRWLGE